MPFNVYSQNILTLCFHFAPSTFCAIVVTYFISMHVLYTVNYQLRFKSHFVFWPHPAACGILSLGPGIEHVLQKSPDSELWYNYGCAHVLVPPKMINSFKTRIFSALIVLGEVICTSQRLNKYLLGCTKQSAKKVDFPWFYFGFCFFLFKCLVCFPWTLVLSSTPQRY